MVRTRVGEVVPGSQPAVDAATVVVIRDGPDGLELLMQERHLETDFVGGALVFPGGRVEDADRDLADDLAVGGRPAEVQERLGATAREARGLLVAAARESFEEAGLLFALQNDGGAVGVDVLAEPEVVAARAALASRADEGDFGALLRGRGLRLDLGAFVPFAWWVTPDGMHRRYDTRFFVAVAPDGQRDAATSDHVETVSARWLRPADALAGGEDGRFTVIFPTRKVLGELASHPTVDAVLASLPTRAIPRVQPELVRVRDTMMVRVGDGPPEIP